MWSLFSNRRGPFQLGNSRLRYTTRLKQSLTQGSRLAYDKRFASDNQLVPSCRLARNSQLAHGSRPIHSNQLAVDSYFGPTARHPFTLETKRSLWLLCPRYIVGNRPNHYTYRCMMMPIKYNTPPLTFVGHFYDSPLSPETLQGMSSGFHHGIFPTIMYIKKSIFLQKGDK